MGLYNSTDPHPYHNFVYTELYLDLCVCGFKCCVGRNLPKHSQQITSLKKKFLLINVTNYYNYVSIRYALHLRHHAVFCRLNSKLLLRENWVVIDKKWLQTQVPKICTIVWNTWSVLNYFKVKITTSSSVCCDYSTSRRPTCRSFATRVSQLEIWYFWVIGTERNVCRCTFHQLQCHNAVCKTRRWSAVVSS